jgi:DHA2 family multidrug resistance protein
MDRPVMTETTRAPLSPPAIPWFGVTAVILGAFISTLNGRLSSFGLADIRGVMHAGFDEGAWITTAQTVAQMLIALPAVWVGNVYGPRRTLLAAATAFCVITLLEPFSPNLPTLLFLQFLGGLASGCFVPLTLGFILRNTPPSFWAYGVAIYALSLELSLNISASLEGWYVDNLSWRWIFWQQTPLAAAMALCLHFGVRQEPTNANPPRPDIYGLATSGLGLALIYAALDQGNRLDWLNSGLVWGLLVAGVLLLVGFFLHERLTPTPAINLKVIFAPPLPIVLVLIAFVRLMIQTTAQLIPQFLGGVRGFRALEVGQTLIWVAAPQLLVCAVAGFTLRRSDPRITASIGFLLLCVACLLAAHGLTPEWGSDQFLPSQLLQALGQSFALSGVLFFAVLHIRPQDALSFGAANQVARLMGGELGSAFVATLSRVRSQVASNQIGQHVQVGDVAVTHRLQAYAALGRGSDPGASSAQAIGILSNVVHSQSVVQSVVDCFTVIAASASVALLLLVAQKAAPRGPASPASLFRSDDAAR